MDSHKLSIKLFAEGADVRGEVFAPLFHSWIQLHAIEGHTLVDVAGYDHVHHGPGTVLVALEGNFSTDRAGGKLGLMYQRKAPIAGATTFAERLRAVLRTALDAAGRVADDPRLEGALRFRTDRWELKVHDRLLAPNDDATLAAIEGDLRAVAREFIGGEATVSRRGAPGELFTVEVAAAA